MRTLFRAPCELPLRLICRGRQPALQHRVHGRLFRLRSREPGLQLHPDNPQSSCNFPRLAFRQASVISSSCLLIFNGPSPRTIQLLSESSACGDMACCETYLASARRTACVDSALGVAAARMVHGRLSLPHLLVAWLSAALAQSSEESYS